MIERLAAAGTGLPTVFVGERSLHSRYDPAGEAEKYVKTLNLGEHGEKIRFFILIEPGLGYTIPVLRRLFPRAKFAALHASDFFTRFPTEALENTVAWSPGSGLPLGEFLEREIPDAGIETVRIVEWRPALAVYGAAYKDLLEGAVSFMRRTDANVRTVKGFGRRWFRNFFKNLGILRFFFRVSPGSLPWIITGAGPGLEEVLPVIADMRREGAMVLAAASSVPALMERGILPDLVISTDGGGWARFHLWEAIRRTSGRPLFLAASLTAALPWQCGGFPILPLSDGSLWQEAVLETLGIPRVVFPQRGTVTASALDLALRCTSGGVFLAGMDLANKDIKTHARPYAFDRFRDERAVRLAPRYSLAFARAGQIAASGSHRVYAEWFGGQLAAYPSRIRSLGKNNPVFDALPGGNTPSSSGAACGTRRVHIETGVFRTMPDASGEAVRVLAHLLNLAGPAESLIRELGPLLLPGDGEIPPRRLLKEIEALAVRKRTGEGTPDE
ncbi:MAG: DUF115 domain-containing protein [Treponema sp.]|jgi:hypothetical protein|nr:DUF115 domain-containing protein [Treponema sp.]